MYVLYGEHDYNVPIISTRMYNTIFFVPPSLQKALMVGKSNRTIIVPIRHLGLRLQWKKRGMEQVI